MKLENFNLSIEEIANSNEFINSKNPMPIGQKMKK